MTTLAVVGIRRLAGREFKDFRLLSSELDRYLGWVDEVVSGGAPGTDKMAVEWARRTGLPYREFIPDLGRYGSPLAFYVRNHAIGRACDLMVAFWDGVSGGTRDAIDYAMSIGKPVEIIEL